MLNHIDNSREFVFGLGSPQGDDQLGWLVVQLLHGREIANAVSLRNVDELLRYFPDCQQAVIVDSCVGGSAVGTVHRFRWPEFCIKNRFESTTHGIDLQYTLRMAESLKILPAEVLVYAVEIQSSRPGDEMSPIVRAAAHELAGQIAAELARPKMKNNA